MVPTAPPSAVPVEVLAQLPLFASLTAVDRDAVATWVQRCAFADAGVIFHEGEPPRWVYVVASGQVKLIKHSADGRDVILHLALPGDLIGGVAAFGRRPYPFTAQAMAPTVALRVAGRDFAALMDRHPAVARQALDDLIEQLTEAHETMKSLAVERVDQRIARQLVKLADRLGRPVPGGVAIAAALSRQDVADMAGAAVETAIRVLSRWRHAGLVFDAGGRLVVADVAALRAIAEGG